MDMKEVNTKLVFIYLGKQLPPYFLANVNLTAENFPNSTYLFIEEGCKIEEPSQPRTNVIITVLKRNNYSELFTLKHEKNFREGFWFYTFERLLYLSQIHESLGNQFPILHIEGDVLLLPSFPMTKIQTSTLKWFQHNERDDVASLIYSPNAEKTSWLHQRLIEEAKSDSMITDMIALHNIRVKNPNMIETFPDVFDSPNEKDIFDGAALGQWLTGMDLRNTYGFQILHENGDFRRNSNSTLNLDSLLRNRDIFIDNGNLFISGGEKTSIVHCLHVHSKDQELFSQQYMSKLQRYVDLTSNRDIYIFVLDWSVLWNSLKQNYLDKSLSRYLWTFLKYLFKGEKLNRTRLWIVYKFFLRKHSK
jgi:hypothetical protein